MSVSGKLFNICALTTLVAVTSLSFFSCKKTDTSGTSQFIGTFKGYGCDEQVEMWTEKAAMPSVGRKEAVAFAQGDDIYVAGGLYKKDFWKYTPSNNSWSQLPDVPGTTFWRKDGIGFVINNKCYVGLGTDIGNVYQADIQEFDPSINTWTTTARRLPSYSRVGALCMVIGDTAFIGGGIDSQGIINNDWWAYVPSVNVWYRMKSMPRRIAFGTTFSKKNQGYICGGRSLRGVLLDSVYRYDRIKDEWTVLPAKFPGGPREGAIAFSIGNTAYCGMGISDNNTQLHKDMYSFNMLTETWNAAATYIGDEAVYAVGAAVNGKGYAGTGGDFNGQLSRWFEFTPKSLKQIKYEISAGSNNYTVNVKMRIGGDTCGRDITLKGTVSGNDSRDLFSMNTQTVPDACGNNYSISGSGTLFTDDSIIISTLITNHKGISACTFRGGK